MSRRDEDTLSASRRGFLATTAGLVAAVGAGIAAGAATEARAETTVPSTPNAPGKNQTEPFWGPRQGGILTPAQSHSYFATFDLSTTQRDDVARLLQTWTSAAARMGKFALEEGLLPCGY